MNPVTDIDNRRMAFKKIIDMEAGLNSDFLAAYESKMMVLGPHHIAVDLSSGESSSIADLWGVSIFEGFARTYRLADLAQGALFQISQRHSRFAEHRSTQEP